MNHFEPDEGEGDVRLRLEGRTEPGLSRASGAGPELPKKSTPGKKKIFSPALLHSLGRGKGSRPRFASDQTGNLTWEMVTSKWGLLAKRAPTRFLEGSRYRGQWSEHQFSSFRRSRFYRCLR